MVLNQRDHNLTSINRNNQQGETQCMERKLLASQQDLEKNGQELR